MALLARNGNDIRILIYTNDNAGSNDPEMTKEIIPVCPWNHQEKLVVARAVEENIDKMALALTSEKRVQDAWNTIFLKPPGKSWSDVIVAIKTNNIARQHTRSAVMAKMALRGSPVVTATPPMRTGPMTAANLPTML